MVLFWNYSEFSCLLIIQIILNICYFPAEINTYHWARMSLSVDAKELFQRLLWNPKCSLAVRRYTFQRLYLNPLLPFLSHLPPPTAPTPLLLPSSLSSLIHSYCFFPDSRLPGQTVSPSSHPGGEGSRKGEHHRAGPGGRGLFQTHLADVSGRLMDQHAALIWNHTTTCTHCFAQCFQYFDFITFKGCKWCKWEQNSQIGI